MHTIAAIATALIAALHFYILFLEMFLWDTPQGRKAFGTTPEFAAQSRVLAANQGLYNGFLAAGLVAVPAAIALALVLASRYAS